uniref:Uncharacterized protein n=2 Tax=Dendroctonus ponderosae TaxID=77166 RepID=A0AAR5QAU3_DENPD
MHRDRNFERRLMVNKFSNRPPFDLKKPKELYGIEEKIKAYPEEACKSCCRNRTETCLELKANKSMPSKNTGKQLGSTPGKRIIETFRKITPANQLETPMSQNSSIQTIYRNSKTCQLGKNIPRHKLMKSLLQNLDSDEMHESKTFPNKGRRKYKNSKKQLFEKDEVVRTDFSVSFNLKQQNRNATVKHSEHVGAPQKMDKKTSTTGLPWPAKSTVQMKKKSSQSCRCPKIDSTNFRLIKEERNADVWSQFSTDSFLEEVPTKDVLNCKKKQFEANIPNKVLETRSCEKREPRRQKSSKTSTQMNNSALKLKSNEKTFVQTQVEKLNKVLKTPKLPDSRYSRKASECFEPRHPQYMPHIQHKKEINSKYIGMMNTIRTNCPRFESSTNARPNESDYEWSEATETSLIAERIKFPRETRIAVDQHLREGRAKIPLSRFTKIDEKICRPAIPQREWAYEHSYLEAFDEINQQGDYARKKKQTTEARKQTPKLNIPCRKNLLCDKGQQHKGQCGYTHNNNKVIY